jgi:integrase
MRKHNPENERVKREYLLYLRNAQGRSEQTLDIAAGAIHRFEALMNYRSFKTFRREQAISFKDHLAAVRQESGKPLSKATITGTLKAVQRFFEWLSREQGYRKAVHYSDAAYFKPLENDVRAAGARRERGAPSVDQVRHVIGSMPTETAAQRRDRAVIALIMLTGARDAAVASLRVKHLDAQAGRLTQDPLEVRTKRAKAINSVYFPVGDDFAEIVRGWVDELQQTHLFGPDDPLFPATKVEPSGDGLFAAVGLKREPWASAGPIREVFREAFQRAGLPYFNPHSLRQTLVREAYARNLTAREFKAWSQNLGHEAVLTSMTSYGSLSFDEQSDVIGNIGDPAEEVEAEYLQLARQLKAIGRRS